MNNWRQPLQQISNGEIDPAQPSQVQVSTSQTLEQIFMDYYGGEEKWSISPLQTRIAPQHPDASGFWCRHDPLHLNHCQYVQSRNDAVSWRNAQDAAGVDVGSRHESRALTHYWVSCLLIFTDLFWSFFQWYSRFFEGMHWLLKYVDSNAMVALLAAPIKRRTIVMTQMSVLLTGIFFWSSYGTALEILCGLQFKENSRFPNCCCWMVGCFVCSCLSQESLS